MSDSNYINLLQLVADPNIVDAWSVCKQKDGGFYIDGKLNGSTLILSLRFRNVGNVASTILTSDLVVTGASCEPMLWHKGDIIDGSKQFQQCKRFGRRNYCDRKFTIQWRHVLHSRDFAFKINR
ncbi:MULTISPECIES: hypothetical protein [unclassified Caballeronia]|uniref:hypothetical protein n=1 Tax=unclassified Caballeronia TaxID=2646786 RepID=UPI001F321179|nr:MULTISPECIES: hypothetical protein [unclassified Caballeronia]MCE4543265.1 hypothetical protein [Caballeronia sp. PC1]MCE4567680.1 hypothetical protein [Caballeronia sp. CLC5]